MRNTPQPPPCFANITASSINQEVRSIVDASAALRDRLVASLTSSTATFANLVRPLLDDANRARCRTTILSVLLSRVSVDPMIRQAARDAQKHISNGETASQRDSALASLVAAVVDKEKDSRLLDDEDRYVLAYIHGQFHRSGANIRDKSERTRVSRLQLEVHDINAAAMKCLTETEEGIWFTRSELAGCPETWLATLKKDQQENLPQDRFWVAFRDDNNIHVLQSAADEKTRRRMFLVGQRRFPENIERLSKVILLRDAIARLLGYEHHSALRLGMGQTMMESAERLRERLLDLHSKLGPLAAIEMTAMVTLKQAEVQSKPQSVDINVTSDSRDICAWDRLYYANIQSKKEFAVDNAKVSEYFEVDHVIGEMLSVFEALFGMEFEAMPHLTTWHESVSTFAAWNSSDEGGGFLGYLFLDIFSRQGKFSSQYHSRIEPGFVDAGGTRHYPVSALVCSYPESTKERPSLLQHRDVRILFHELGHAIHNLVARTKYDTGQARDFGEIPSNMLEHFVWLPVVIIRLSRHYTSLPAYRPEGDGVSRQHAAEDAQIPLYLANALARTKSLNQATGLLGLIQPALFDLAIYTPQSHREAASVDTTALWNETRRKYLPYKYPENEEMFGQAAFSPFFRAYDSNYFTYVMSRVYAADLYQAAFAKDPLSPQIGRRWRHEVLEQSASQPQLEMLERFLGRPLSIDAIFQQIASGQKD